MEYNDLEFSVDSAAPIEFYTFAYQDQVRRYCTATYPIDKNGFTFEPEALSRGSTEVTSDMNRQPIKITTHKNFEPAILFIQGIVHFPMTVMIQRGFEATLTPEYQALLFKGRVVNASFTDYEVTLQCDPVTTSLQRPGLRKTYEPSCVHSLYSPYSCKVDKANHEHIDTIVSHVNGKVLTLINVYADDYFTGGFINIEGAMYLISTSTGNTLTLSRFAKFAGTPAVKVYPGCMHNRRDCHVKFNNIANFGGFSWMPTKNPFIGDPISRGGNS